MGIPIALNENDENYSTYIRLISPDLNGHDLGKCGDFH